MATTAGENFAARLKAIRERLGVTLYQLAKKSGLRYQSLWRLEANRTEPKWLSVCILAKALGVPVAEFALDVQLPEPGKGKKEKTK